MIRHRTNRTRRAGRSFGSARALVRLCLAMLTALPALGRAASIDNTAFISFTQGGQTETVPSNIASVPIKERTPAEIEFKAYANGTSGSTSYSIDTTRFMQSGGGSDTMAPPELFGTPIDLSTPVPLQDAGLYRSGAPIFVVLTDPDQNINPTIQETISIQISVAATGDREIILLKEDGPDSGIFVGYIQSSSAGASSYDGLVSVADRSEISANYIDTFDVSDTAATAAAVNPFGLVFDTSSGESIPNATIRLVDEATGMDAVVYDEDGVTEISAVIASDENGAYQFPVVPPGEYRMELFPPSGFIPSQMTEAEVQALPGAPYELSDGSFGGAFTIGADNTFLLDIPLDEETDSAFIVKTASKDEMGIGEFIRYEITVSNPNVDDIPNVEIVDTQPYGFRYETASSYLDGARIDDPVVSDDGRELRYDLGTLAGGESHTIQYVARTGAGCKEGEAINVAVLQSESAGISFEATARVYVEDDMRTDATIIGRVAIDPHPAGIKHDETPSSGQTNRWEGVPGVRIYMENGAYVITDKDGLYHFEGVSPGTHVLQIDTSTLPDGLEPKGIENTRFAGRSFSQFVEVQQGTLWRADFPLIRLAPPESKIDVKMKTEPVNGKGGVIEVNLKGRQAPVGKLTVMVMAPDGVPVEANAIQIDGVPVEAEQMDNIFTFRLDESEDDWAHRIELPVLPEDRSVTNEYKVMVMYDWGSQRNQRLPLHVHSAAMQRTQRSNLSGVLPKLDASDVMPMGEPVEAEQKLFTPEWVETLEPGLEIVAPIRGSRPDMPAVHVGVKHGEKDFVKLSINGMKVSQLLYEGKTRNAKRTLVVSQWRGVPVQDGWNELEAIIYNEAGSIIGRAMRKIYYAGAPVSMKYLADQSTLIADGRTVPTVRVQFFDKNGEPARAGVIGEFNVEAPYTAYRVNRGMDNSLTVINRDRPSFTIHKNGIAELQLEPTSVSGEAILKIPSLGKTHEEIKVWLEAPLREWIMVGFAEGTAGYNDLSSGMESYPEGEKDGYYDDGKVALFAKGRVKGDFLMTMAYDTSKDTDPERNSLFQQIDPDTYYTLYADESQNGYEAPSSEKLYLKIEKKTFYALFGDYTTGLTVTELGKYSRSMTGFKSEYQGKHFKYNAFASETGQGFIKDEIRGNGTSGLYTLSSGNIVYNSETITIEVRDRYHNEQVVSSETLTRHSDYSIDYTTGELYFKKPVPSRDPDLNLYYIVVDYEIDNGDEESLTYGGRAAVKTANDKLEVGITAIQEGQPDADADELYAADVEVELTRTTKIRAEVAQSEATDPVEGRQDGNAQLVELLHDSERTSGRVYYRNQSEDFGLNQQSAGESGSKKYGALGSARFNQAYQINAEVYRQENLVTDAKRDVANTDIQYDKDRVGLRAGLLYANDTLSSGEEKLSEQVYGGVSYEVWKDKVEVRVDHYESIQGNNANEAFPTRTVLGLDYYLTDSTKLFTEYELGEGDVGQSQNMRVGIESEPWHGGRVNSAVGQEINEAGPRTFSTLGLYQTYDVTEKWSVNAGFDMAETMYDGQTDAIYTNLPPASGDVEDFWAVSLGTGYEELLWSWVQRGEYLWSDDSERWSYVTGVIGQIKPRLSMSLSTAVFDQEADTEDQFSVDVRQGTAYRPLESDWVLLNRLDLIYDERESVGSTENSQRIVDQLNLNYHPSCSLQMSFRYGCKYVIDNYDSDQYDAFTDLYGWEMRYDLNRKWDIGYRLLALHGWSGHDIDWATGPSIGYNLAENMWLSLGYNFNGFYDEDFSASNYTADGPYLRFRIKFDQESMNDLNTMLKSMVGK